jgi:hypothetical protein
MSTNAVITMNVNTESAATKDDVGLADKPSPVSKAWSVRVDSLDVTDAGALLTAIKSLTPFHIYWDETVNDGDNNNQEPEGSTFSRGGDAFINDLTLTWDDRTNSVKNIQFTGTGAIAHENAPEYELATANSLTKGQFVRLFLTSGSETTPTKVLGGAKQLSMHISLSLEDATSKDTTGDFVRQEPTSLSYDISTTALVRSGDTITSQVGAKDLNDLESIYENAVPVKWLIANVSGANNRTKGNTIASGQVVLTSLEITAQVKTSAQYTAQLQGYGAYTVGS